jgi:hypothetical protein
MSVVEGQSRGVAVGAPRFWQWLSSKSATSTAAVTPGFVAAPVPRPQASAIPGSHVTWEAEAFIPVSRFEIAEQMVARGQWGETLPDTVRRLFRYVAAWRHVVYKERLDELEETYLPFSPETDLLRLGNFSEAQLADYRQRFISGVRRLLRQANFIEVSRDELRDLMRRGSQYGLDLAVDLDDFEECLIYRRGTDLRTEMRASVWTLYLWKQPVRFGIYQRLCLVLKLWPFEERVRQVMAEKRLSQRSAERLVRKSRSSLPEGMDNGKIYVKLFKDIPHADLEMLFPNTRVKFSRLDKIRLGGSAAGGVGIGVFGIVTKLLAAAVLSPYAIVVALFGIGGIIVRQIMGFFNQHTHYMKVLAQNLYFHSLADNRSAFTLLANRAEEEDVKEEMLLYTMLAGERVHRHELPDAKAIISSYLHQAFDVDVDFDIEDALGRLIRDGLVREDANGQLQTLPPQAALAHLDQLWDSYLQPGGMDRRLLSEEVP